MDRDQKIRQADESGSELGVETEVPKVDSGPSVFISYRRADTAASAMHLASRLREDIGARSVFRDRDDLILGEPWSERLQEAVSDSDATLALVGPRWVHGGGDRDLASDDDVVRAEIRCALDPANWSAVLPVLVDQDEPPDEIPRDISAMFSEPHFVSVARDAFESPPSPSYQAVLVGIWNVLRRRLPRGVLIIGERRAMASLDRLVDEMKGRGLIDAQDLSRFASGAYVATFRKTRRFRRRYQDVIVNVEDDEMSDDLRARVAAVMAHPYIERVAFVGAGAVGATAVMQTLGADLTGKVSTTSVGQMAGSSLVPSALSGAAVTTKAVVAAAAVTAAAVGTAVVVDDSDIDLDGSTRLAARQETNVDTYPLGEPGDVVVGLDGEVPVSEDETASWFGNFEGGEAVRRTATVTYGDVDVELGEIVVPVAFPPDFLELNVGDNFQFSEVSTEQPVDFVPADTGAFSPCTFEGTGDTVGGWQYTGERGDLTLTVTFSSDGTAMTDLGMGVQFEGPASVVFFDDVIDEVIPADVDINDQCTPQERAEVSWAAGAMAEQG